MYGAKGPDGGVIWFTHLDDAVRFTTMFDYYVLIAFANNS